MTQTETYEGGMFFLNQNKCPMKECNVMQGWTALVPAVLESEGVDAKAEVPAKKCDAAAPDNYKMANYATISNSYKYQY